MEGSIEKHNHYIEQPLTSRLTFPVGKDTLPRPTERVLDSLLFEFNKALTQNPAVQELIRSGDGTKDNKSLSLNPNTFLQFESKKRKVGGGGESGDFVTISLILKDIDLIKDKKILSFNITLEADETSAYRKIKSQLMMEELGPDTVSIPNPAPREELNILLKFIVGELN